MGFEPLESRGIHGSRLLQVYPSGQRGRTQDPLCSASQVRILPPAPTHSHFSVNSQLKSSSASSKASFSARHCFSSSLHSVRLLSFSSQVSEATSHLTSKSCMSSFIRSMIKLESTQHDVPANSGYFNRLDKLLEIQESQSTSLRLTPQAYRLPSRAHHSQRRLSRRFMWPPPVRQS